MHSVPSNMIICMLGQQLLSQCSLPIAQYIILHHGMALEPQTGVLFIANASSLTRSSCDLSKASQFLFLDQCLFSW